MDIFQIGTVVIGSTIGIIGVILNGVMLLSLVNDKALRKKENTIWITNLVVVDLAYCVSVLPIHITYMTKPIWYENILVQIFCILEIFNSDN